MPRQMPKKGFYVVKEDDPLLSHGYKEVFYTTGVRGQGGHKHCRCLGRFACMTDDQMEWTTLLWTCVPAQKELDEDYNYYENFEDIPKHWNFPDFP
jgi:hypothetical protein